MQGLLIPSRAPSFPASQFLMPNHHLVPWACRQRAKVSLMDMFSKGQLSLKSTQIFLYHPYAEASDKNALFSPLYQRRVHTNDALGAALNYSVAYQIFVKALPGEKQGTYYPGLRGTVAAVQCRALGEPSTHCPATAPECLGPQAYCLMFVLSAVPSSHINLQESSSCP